MTCQRCSSARILNVNSHGRDCNVFRIGRHEHEGYVPAEFGIGCGDDVEFAMCLECGQVQGAFPIGLTSLEMKTKSQAHPLCLQASLCCNYCSAKRRARW
jgi:hypothetical protein